MSRIQITALLALAALTLPDWALAQRFAFRPDPPPLSNPGGVNQDDDVEICGSGSGGASRLRENCELETETLRVEQTLKLSIELPAIPSAECAASTTTEYQQWNTAARVSGAISISDCAAASGAFKLAVRVKDDNGEKVLEFDEAWQRSDNRDVSFGADYPIGDDVELVSVRVRGLTCTCADPPATEQ